MKNQFAHLHVHTEYSLLDGLSKVGRILERVQQLDMENIAITDHGVMYGAIDFYKKMGRGGIKPIIGMETYITHSDLKDRPERSKMKNYHLLLLAKNNKGYKNLMALTSIAHLEGYYYRPRIDRETLKKYSDGLICTSACALGELGQAIIESELKKAKETAVWYLDVFGENYYLELQRHEYKKFITTGLDEDIKSSLINLADNEKSIEKEILNLSRNLGIPIVATNDAHYVEEKDAIAQDALVCVATGKNVTDKKRLRFIDSASFYIKSPDEMYQLFSDLPDSLQNTISISKKCDVQITLDKWFFPKYELELSKSPDSELEEKSWRGIAERVDHVDAEIKARLEYELKIILQKGYSTYFLIVADMARWCNERGIVTNTRGSTAGSLVAYALGIVNINPLVYDLPFERFLTPWRPSPPDIDFDIADNRREEVIEYITQKYGKEKVAQICTFGRMLARGSVRDVARVLGYPYSTGDRIAKAIPLGSQGFPMTIDKALLESSDLKRLYESDADCKKVIDLARQIEGNARHISVHAAGIVIAPENIVEYTPIQLDPEGQKVITQYDMDALDPNVSPGEAIGLLKFDLLGLRNLSILGSAVEIIKKERNLEIMLHKIPLDDKKTYTMLSHGDTMGVFQLSGSGMTKHLQLLKPTMVEDLMAMVALYRPGPMTQIPEYIDRKNNPAKVSFFDDRMKDYLGKSYGLLVYQDDVFMTAINIAGYTWEEADKFRKAVGKKIPQEMQKQKDKFIQGAIKKGMKKAKAEDLFKLIEPFSGYGFNKAHAASYGMVAYWTAYLKANYPVEFMCALLTAESADNEKISLAVNECRRMKIKVLAPDINESNIGFDIVKDDNSLEGSAIRFGLSAIKNVGKAAIEEILTKRKEEKFVSFHDFVSRVDTRKLNKKVVESLIKVGALSNFGNRATLISALDLFKHQLAKPKSDENQNVLFTDEDLGDFGKNANSKILEIVEEFSDEEIQNLEKQLLGFSLSAKPLSELIGNLANLATHKISDVSIDNVSGNDIKLAVIVSEVRVIITKKTGSEMAFVKIVDETGTMEMIVFPNVYQKFQSILGDSKPILVSGKIDQRDEDYSIIAEGIETTEVLNISGSTLYIKVPKDATEDNLKQLKNLLLANRGNQKVTLVFEGKERKVINLDLLISWNDDLARKIDNIFHGKNTN